MRRVLFHPLLIGMAFFAVAAMPNHGMTRQAALRKMLRPFNRAISAFS